MKNRRTILLIVLLLAICITNAYSQNSIKGRVTEKTTGESLAGVTIYIKQLNKGTTTDFNGNYNLNVPDGIYNISYSFIGFDNEIRTIKLRKKDIILDISLNEKTQELEAAIITAKSEARQIREQAMPISVITMKEIQGKVSDVSDVLSKTAGVKIRTSGGVGSASRISVRGLEGKRIGFFIDGTPLNDNKDFLDINDIPVDLIERVEIYKGIVPAKLGGAAVGGAVNIVLKEYPARYLDASYSIKSFNTHNVSTVFKRNIEEKGYEYGLGGFYTYSDNNYKMELPLQPGTEKVRDHDVFEKKVIGGGFSSETWWFDEVAFEPAIILSKKEIQGIEYNIQEAYNTSEAYVLLNNDEKENFLINGLDIKLTNTYAYTIYEFKDKAMSKYSWDGQYLPAATDLGGEIGKQPNDSYNKKHSVFQKTNLSYTINSCNAINLNSQYNFAKGIPEDKLKDEVIGYRTNFESTMNSWVTGLAHEYNTPGLKFTNSFTVKHYYYSMKTKLVDLYGMNIPENVNMKKHDFGVNNALRFRFTPLLLAKASVAYDVRLPSEYELLGDGFIVAPAGNLEPERNTSFNIGFMYDKTNKMQNRFQFEINSFYMQLENMIRFTGGPLQNIYQNFGEMRTLGVEGDFKWDVTQFLYMWANVTYQDLRDTRKLEPSSSVPNPTKGDRMPNIPYLFSNGGFELHKANLFGGKGQNTRFFSDYSFIEEYSYDFELSNNQQRRIPRAFVFNVGLEQSLKNQRFSVSIQANNLMDKKILSEFNRPLPGRNFGLKIRYIWK